MSIIVSGISPRPIGLNSSAPQSPTPILGAAPLPAATLEISATARLASASLQGQMSTQKIQPLNIIWGNGAK